MKVKDKEKFNYPLRGWQILSAISSMVFHTVQWGRVGENQLQIYEYIGILYWFAVVWPLNGFYYISFDISTGKTKPFFFLIGLYY